MRVGAALPRSVVKGIILNRSANCRSWSWWFGERNSSFPYSSMSSPLRNSSRKFPSLHPTGVELVEIGEVEGCLLTDIRLSFRQCLHMRRPKVQ